MTTPKIPRPSDASLLAGMPATARELAAHGVIRSYRARTVLIGEGDQGDAVFVVLLGVLRIFCSAANGREITLALYGPGEYVGEMSLDGGVRSASVVTETACVCAVVSGHALRQHLAQDAAFALDLIQRLIRRTRLTTDSARSLALLDAYSRLTKLFDALAVSRADGTRMVVERLTHQDISQRVGCSRELVSRLLKDLVKGGYLALELRQYVLLKRLPARW